MHFASSEAMRASTSHTYGSHAASLETESGPQTGRVSESLEAVARVQDVDLMHPVMDFPEQEMRYNRRRSESSESVPEGPVTGSPGGAMVDWTSMERLQSALLTVYHPDGTENSLATRVLRRIAEEPTYGVPEPRSNRRTSRGAPMFLSRNRDYLRARNINREMHSLNGNLAARGPRYPQVGRGRGGRFARFDGVEPINLVRAANQAERDAHALGFRQREAHGNRGGRGRDRPNPGRAPAAAGEGGARRAIVERNRNQMGEADRNNEIIAHLFLDQPPAYARGAGIDGEGFEVPLHPDEDVVEPEAVGPPPVPREEEEEPEIAWEFARVEPDMHVGPVRREMPPIIFGGPPQAPDPLQPPPEAYRTGTLMRRIRDQAFSFWRRRENTPPPPPPAPDPPPPGWDAGTKEVHVALFDRGAPLSAAELRTLRGWTWKEILLLCSGMVLVGTALYHRNGVRVLNPGKTLGALVEARALKVVERAGYVPTLLQWVRSRMVSLLPFMSGFTKELSPFEGMLERQVSDVSLFRHSTLHLGGLAKVGFVSMLAGALGRRYRSRNIVSYEATIEPQAIHDQEMLEEPGADFRDQQDIRTHPLRSGNAELPARPIKVTIVRKERPWGFWDEVVSSNTFIASEQLLSDIQSPRVMPQGIIGDDAAIGERIDRYLATASHVNTRNRGLLMQNTSALARILAAERYNVWAVHRAVAGFRSGVS